MEEKHRRSTRHSPPRSQTDRVIGLDLSFQGLRCLNAAFLQLTSIKELQLNNNEIESIPRAIYKLKCLEKLNLAFNCLKSVPPELGKLVSLKELYLNDNAISSVPMELGTLYNLEVLNLSNNPLISPFNTLSKDKGLIQFCRENNTGYPPPSDRAWIETAQRKDMAFPDALTVGTFNILTNYYAVKCTYAPSWVVTPELRKENILNSILSYNVDVLGLQEIELHMYQEFYKPQLEQRLEYESMYVPRSRAHSLPDRRAVDGCATFWKRTKFKLVENSSLEFFSQILSDPRFASNQDVINRNIRKDNVALFTVLELADESKILVVNTHIYWDPEFSDVKLLQAILLIEEIEKFKNRYPATPIVLLGDFNSLVGSDVYRLIIDRTIDGLEFGLYDYSPFNTGFTHSLAFSDSHAAQGVTFTNFTPSFKNVIDYIFHSDELFLTGVLSPIEEEYTELCVGLPNIHFPSDHIFVGARYCMKNKIKKIEPPK